MHAAAHEAHDHLLDPAGALAFVNAYAASAASPALSHACAERQPACPVSPLEPTLGGDTCNVGRQRHVPRSLAATGRRPHPMAVYKPPALRDGRLWASSTAPQRSMRGAAPCAHGATDRPSPCALRAITGRWCPPCATMISSGACPSLRSPSRSPVTRCPRAGPQTPPPMPHARAHSSSHTGPRSPPSRPNATPGAPGRRQRPPPPAPDQGAQKLRPACPALG